MSKYIFIKQQDEQDCGIACMAMILKKYKSEVPFHKLRELSGTDMNGTSALGIKKCMELYNFKCQVIKINTSILVEEDIPLPLIAHITVNNSFSHYVVIHKIEKNELIISDPANGVIKKSIIEFSREWSGVLILCTPEKEYKPSKEKLSTVFTFIPILFKQKGIILNIIIASLALTLFGILSSYYLQGIIDYFVPSHAITALNTVSIGLLAMIVVQGLFEYSRSYLLLILGQYLSIDIMLSYIKYIFKLPMSFFSTRKSGEIISRFIDASKIIDALASATLSIFLDVAMVVVIGTVLAIQNSTLFLITMASIPFYCITIFSFVKIYERANEEEMEASSILNSSIIESLKGIETIKSYNNEQKVYDRIDSQFIAVMKKSFRATNLDNIQNGIKQIIQLISNVLILWIGSFYIINGSLTLGQLITYNALLIFFTEPLKNIINLQVKIQTANVANKRLNEIFFIESEVNKNNRNKIKNSKQFKDNLIFNNVSFGYNMKPSVIKNISISIPFNSKIAIVGESGSGKSTLAKLLVKFYSPIEGNICFNKINIQDIDTYFLRENVIYIPQESFFFSASIYENLIFGVKESIDFEEILKVCELVNILDFINNEPLRFDTIIEEGGNNLSGGQKQRFAIARALLSDSNILILDEATSAMDAKLEKKIIEELLKIENKTIIFIVHELKIAQQCSVVLVIHEGELVEYGSHDDLILSGGKYCELWRI
ncbi:peptide cleavage/export ABC transporter [Carnobacterium maltaromaticum]|uniref:peptide cleavage/export ABC transporter n=1 Tax=Carnobacterium maltaromaticum TaxID=2751 RepID=UPI0039BECD75